MNQENKTWPNVDFFTWPYEEQTEMKHKVLSFYLEPWAKIRSSQYKGLNFVDGFGGCGAYHTKEDVEKNQYKSNNFGSPIFSTEAIAKQQSEGRIDKAYILIIDENQENLDNIEKVVKYKKLKLKPDYKKGDFDKVINGIIDQIEKDKMNLNPTFFFIDPFGFSLKFETIRRILSLKNTEVFINFMYNAIQRFAGKKDIEKTCTSLFGCNDWKDHITSHTQKKETALVKLFWEQCKKFVEFVYPFKLNFPDKNRPYYYLFHLCHHYKGCSIMKDVFAKRNNDSLEYRGNNYTPTLFDVLPKHQRLDSCGRCFLFEGHNCKNCGDAIIKKFDKQQISFRNILEQIIDKTPLLERDIKKILQEMEKNEKINITPAIGRKGKRRQGFIEGDLIYFK